MDAYKLTLIAAGLIILLVFFGGSGTDNLRVRTKAEKWEDALDKASQRDPRMPTAIPGTPATRAQMPQQPGVAPFYNNRYGGPPIDYYPANPVGTVPNSPQPGVMNPNHVPFPQQRPKWVTTPPEGTPAPSQLPDQSWGDPDRLRSGKKMVFRGTEVFVEDEHGKLVPLPDGIYYSQDSRHTFLIRNGKRYVN